MDSKAKLEVVLESIEELLKFHINRDEFCVHKKNLEEFLLKISKSEKVKTKDPESLEGIFDHENLQHNLKTLESYYQKNLNPDEVNECFYIKDKKALSPSKFTPFARQGAANKHLGSVIRAGNEANQGMQSTTNGKRMYISQRVLSYEVSDSVNANSNLSDFQPVSKPIAQTPETRGVPATPMSTALGMYNWLNEKVKKIKKVIFCLVASLLMNIKDSTRKPSKIHERPTRIPKRRDHQPS